MDNSILLGLVGILVGIVLVLLVVFVWFYAGWIAMRIYRRKGRPGAIGFLAGFLFGHYRFTGSFFKLKIPKNGQPQNLKLLINEFQNKRVI